MRLDIRDDPDHPEGGHALVLFPGAAGPTGAATLLIEPLTDGFVYSGPRQIEALGERTERGLLFAIGGGLLDTLPPGVAVTLLVRGTTLEADVLWPALTPLRAMSRRTGVRAGGPRRSVAQGPATGARPGPRLGGGAQPDPAPAEAPADAASEILPAPTAATLAAAAIVPPASIATVAFVGPDPGAVRADAAPEADLRTDEHAVNPASSSPVRPSVHDRPPPAPQSARWRLPAVAALAFCAGITVPVALAWMRPPPAPAVKIVSVTPQLPSPYDVLHSLSDLSPRGTPVELAESDKFMTRSHLAKSAEEKSIWREWATRVLLETKANGAAATLSDFATDLAMAHVDQPTLAAARFLWEMAALAEDCAAMDNIALALATDGDPGGAGQITTWRARAARCRSRPKTGPH